MIKSDLSLNLEQIKDWIIREKGPLTLEEDLARVQTGEPVDYVIGFSHFLNLKIDLSFRPLIPRPETEFWVSELIKTIQADRGDLGNERSDKIKILDLCAGSGCVGLALLKALPHVTVDFTDINSDFLKQVRLNAEINGIDPNRFRVMSSDVWEGIAKGEKYKYIATNPPYIPSNRKTELDPSVINFEPNEALFSGVDGLDVIREIITRGRDYLKPEGEIWLEFDTEQADLVLVMAQEAGYQRVEIKEDQYSRPRYVILRG